MLFVIGIAGSICDRASWGVWVGFVAPLLGSLCTHLFLQSVDQCCRWRNFMCPMISTNLVTMSWNLCGMNLSAKRAAICELGSAHRTLILFLQETKIET